MPPRKLLSQQKGNLTVEQQENKKATEEANETAYSFKRRTSRVVR